MQKMQARPQKKKSFEMGIKINYDIIANEWAVWR